MQPKPPRKPGDQAPPPRPPHRNNTKTATTHVTSTDGRYYVHDGNGNTVVIDGQRAENLTRDDARRAKDYAVTKLKMRTAGIRQHVDNEPGQSEADEAPPIPDSFIPASAPPTPDPAVARQRQAAVSAARPAAVAAQQRADQKAKSKSVQRAAGWEPPPAGVTGARQAPKPQKVEQKPAPGFEKPRGGAKSGPPETDAVVSVDPVEGDGSLELDGTDDVADILGGGGDLETEVKRTVEETENKVIEACKTLAPGDAVLYYPDDSDSITAAVVTVHAPTCITIQLPGDEDEVKIDEEVTSVGEAHQHPKLASQLNGQVMKAVMLTPREGKRAGTWAPIL